MRLCVHTACDGSATGNQSERGQIITWVLRGLISPYGHEQRHFDGVVETKKNLVCTDQLVPIRLQVLDLAWMFIFFYIYFRI